MGYWSSSGSLETRSVTGGSLMPLFNTLKDKLLFYENRTKGTCYVKIPFSLIDGKNITIDMLMYVIVKFFVKDKYRVIVDPTCGKQNHQFAKITDILEHWGITYLACDRDPQNWSGRVCDVFCAETLPEGEVFVYDPPFTPTARGDARKRDYGIDINRSVMAIKRYYGEQVFRNFEKRGARLIIVKGQDFYYPVTSDRLFLFLRDILTIPGGWRPIAVIAYRYYNSNNVLNNVRLAQSMEKRGIMRTHIVHSYYVILKKE